MVLTGTQSGSRRGTVLAIARRAFAGGYVEDAAWMCDCLLREDPLDAEVSLLRFDVCVKAGQYAEAYDLIGRFVRPRADTDVLLRAAFAAAITGRPTLEMKRFCDGFLSWRDPVLPQGERSSRALLISASLALAIDARTSGLHHVAETYLAFALREDPTNPVGACLREELCSERQDFAGALDALIKGRGRMMPEAARRADARMRDLRALANGVRRPALR